MTHINGDTMVSESDVDTVITVFEAVISVGILISVRGTLTSVSDSAISVAHDNKYARLGFVPICLDISI